MKNVDHPFINPILSELKKQTMYLERIMELLSVKGRGINKEFLTTKEAAKILGKSPQTIRRLIHSGTLNSIKLYQGKDRDHFLITKKDIEEMVGYKIN